MHELFPGNKPQGFSLIEMLLVFAIFSLVLASLFSALQQNENASEIIQEETEIQQNLQDILSLMVEELRQAGYPPSSYYDTAYLSQTGADRNLAAHGLLETLPQSLKFDGDINPKDHPNDNGRINYVHYSLSGSVAPYTLKRLYGEVTANGILPSGGAQKISEQVESLTFRYFDSPGVETHQTSEVKVILIELSLRTRKIDPLTRHYRTVSGSVKIRPINL
jgi:type II secretion system protein J